jgi:hypothetical protein
MAERRAFGGFAALAVVVVAATAAAVALSGSQSVSAASPRGAATLHAHGSAEVAGTPARHTGPQGRVPQFVATCTYTHSAPDDPIVHYQHPGRSHRHDFYGSPDTNAYSTADLLTGGETSCDKPADTAAYWQPTLYEGDEAVVPLKVDAYYRPGVGVDPAVVEPFPFGLELIAGDPTRTEASQMDQSAGWVCGASPEMHTEPPDCPGTAPLHMVLTFPDCWDGRHTRSDDFRSHAAYSTDGECPDTHPVHVPQLMMSINYGFSGPADDLRLASGNVHSAHGDFFNAWDPEGLEREVANCINRDVVCDVVSNRAEDGPFFTNSGG